MTASITRWRWAIAITFIAAAFSASADTRVSIVWTCTLNEGKTVEDLNAVHGKWVDWANSQSYGGDIRGAIASTGIAANFQVLIIDSYPDMATFAADSETYPDSEEGQAIDAEYDAVSTCTGNALYEVTDSGSD